MRKNNIETRPYVLTLNNKHEGTPARIDMKSMPRPELNRLDRVVFRAALRAFEDPAVRADYERWQAERREKEAK